ncbi:kinase-like protein [Calocera viscosa TUFC12733]|uniref:Kinase-like protein n=1 Tax=Calocera viscosa (strain TUFC12733) TaxID=1330018 RepID=A0A167NQ84_CALVF|nr:kinase-like protein [Calocera viscosa TUFC12733]
MSRNDIFSTSFRIQPPPNPPAPAPSPSSSAGHTISHSHSNSLPEDPYQASPPSQGSTLARARTTGQSWLRDRAQRAPPPLQLASGLHRNRSVHIADRAYVYLLPDLPDPLSPHADEQEPETLSLELDTHTPLGSPAGPSRTSSFFDLPARIGPGPPSTAHHHHRPLTSSSSDFSSAYSTRSNPSLMEELPWEARPGEGGGDVVDVDVDVEDVRIRLREERRFFLGEGRFAKVWLAAYCKPRRHRLAEEEEQGEGTPVPEKSKWRLCAAKQPLPDAESQLLGRREAFFLRHLRKPNLAALTQQLHFADGRKHIVRLLGIVRSSTGGGNVHSLPPPLPVTLPPADGDQFHRPSLPHASSSQLTATPLPQQKPDPFHLAPPTPQSLRHVRSVSDTLTSSLLSPTPHAPRPRSRAASPVRNWLSALPPSPPSPAAPDPQQQQQQQADITLLLSYHSSGSLSSLLFHSPHALTPALYTTLAHQLALALAYTHSCSVLHTDLKPQNVLLSPSPSHQGTFSASLADFGSALLLPPYASPPTDGLGLGTPGYTAPELLLPPGSGSFSYSADIFSLGVVLGVLLLGREPYAGLVGRGRGRLEMMRWARRGEYWGYEEGVRLAHVGGDPREAERGKEEEEEREKGERLAREDVWELLRDEEEEEEDEGGMWTAHPREGEDEGEDGSLAHPPGLLEHTAFSSSASHAGSQREPIPLPSPPNSPPRSAPPSRTALPTPTPAAPYPDGSPPIFFLGPSPSGHRTRAPDELVGLVKRMCCPRPEGRPGMEEVVRVLGALRGAFDQVAGE